jgi:5'-3' exonuclease
MDQDFHQLLGDNCQQYSPASKKILDSNYVLQRYGVSVENFITARSFIGDTSDGIPGIKGAGFKSLVKRFPELSSDDFVSVDDILNICSERSLDKPLKMYGNMLENPEAARRNWKLMYLDVSNLSAEHIKNLEYGLENYEQNRDKLNLLRSVISEGVDIPRGLDVDRLYMRINSVIKR